MGVNGKFTFEQIERDILEVVICGGGGKFLGNDAKNKLKIANALLLLFAIIFANASSHVYSDIKTNIICYIVSFILGGIALLLTFKFNLSNKIFASLVFVLWIGYVGFKLCQLF